MSKKAIIGLTVVAIIVSTASFMTYSNNKMNAMNNNIKEGTEVNNNMEKSNLSNHDYAKGIIKPMANQPIKKFNLTAVETKKEIKEGVTLPVWTYNGTVPGEEIRVTQGDFVQVKLKNLLKEPITIHWHGYPLKSSMDGIPGLTQDAIKPGETFTYEFSADVPGTYWYHSHQEGSKQVDKGLYGSLIVEPKEKEKIDKDYVLMLDEWMEKPIDDMNSMPGMGNKNNEASQNNVSEEELMGTMYNIYTVNGKSGSLIEPLAVKKGDNVRLRLINSGYRSHGIHIPGKDIKIVSTDGQNINEAGVVKDQIIMVAPGERYDVEFTVNNEEDFVIDAHDNNKYSDQIKIPVKVIDGNGKSIKEADGNYAKFDLTSYGKAGTGSFKLKDKYDLEYDVVLDGKIEDGTQKYTINGKTFDELPPLELTKGQNVKLTYINKSNVDHPMHLHGHFFEVIAKNGKAVTGATVKKDTLLIGPGESYTVAFKADNPGNWVQHCHELHHAAAGMMQRIVYKDFVSNYSPNPKDTFNKPE